VFVGVLVVGFGAVIVYSAVELGHVPRIECLSCRTESAEGEMNVLVVGSDSRAAAASATNEFGTPQTVTGQRSDTIMVLHVEANRTKASVLSIPRDLWVPIASGGVNRINTAFDKGPDNLIRTITRNFDIPIDHYVEVDFNGFRGIVRAVGGVTVYFPTPARDLVSGLKVPKAGCTFLDGEGALSYVRSRHYETMIRGRWRSGGAGDLDRITRQQDFIRRVIGKVRGVRNPVTLHRLISTGTHSVRFDKRLSVSDIETLARRFHSLAPDSVEMSTIPAVFDHVLIDGKSSSVLRVQQPDAKEAIDRFLGRRSPPASSSTSVVPTSATTRLAPGEVTTTTLPERDC
jgi:LCP family protein required for cell wall assembly